MKSHSRRSSGNERRTYSLVFPRDLEADQVTAWVRSLSGAMRGASLGWGDSPTIGFELWATSDGLTHRLHVPGRDAEYVVAQLRSLVPGIRVTPEPDQSPTAWTRAVEVGIRGSHLPLRIYSAGDMAASMLASVQLLARHEVVLVQWVMMPARPTRPPPPYRAPPRTHSPFETLVPTSSANRDLVNERREKLEEPIMLAVLRVAALANSPGRADQLMSRVRAALAATRGPNTQFVRRFVGRQTLAARISAVAKSAIFPIQLSAPEVTALIGWPVGEPHVAGLPQARTRQLPASGSIARTGRILALSNFPGHERPLALTAADSLKHLHVCGPTGTGKTILLANLAAQDMAAGRGVVVIDGKAGQEALFSRCLERIPSKRIDDTIVLDVNDGQHPVGFNILSEGQPRAVVDELCALFDLLYRETRAVWTREVLYHGLSTLVAYPGCTFPDLAPLLMPMQEGESAWRDQVIDAVTDRELRNFWQRFRKQPEAAQARFVQPVLDRIWQLNSRPPIRNIIGQSQSSFTMREVVSEGRVLLINLAGLGRETASLAGTLIVNALWRAVQAAPHHRPVMLYLDEFQDFLQLPLNPADIFAKARAFGLGITAAHQELGQLPTELRQAVLANARSKVVFQCSADDARAFAREFGRPLSDEDFMRLGQYEVLLRLATDDGVSEPVSGKTYPPSPSTELVNAVRARSRQKYGRSLTAVEAEIAARRSAPEGLTRKRPRLGGETWG